MTPALALALACLAAAPSPPRLTAPGFSGVNVDAKTLTFLSDHLAQQLTQAGLRVVTASELAAVLGLERQKQLLGCGSDSCLAELSGALGADGVVVGSVGRFDDGLQLNVKIVSAKDGATLAAFSRRVPSEGKALDALTEGAKAMAAKLLEASAPAVAAARPDKGPPPPPAGTPCKAAGDCGKGHGCDGETRTCRPAGPYGAFVDGQLCDFHDQCLFGVCAKSGRCKSPPACHGVRSDCGEATACCPATKATCQRGFCCLPDGERCAQDRGCCSGSCVDGRCGE